MSENKDIDAQLVSGRIDIGRVIDEIAKNTSEKGSGAIVVFTGVVKGVVDEHKVYSLVYNAYEPYASQKLWKIAEEELRDHGVLSVRIYHRIGELKPGEPTIYIFVSAKNRDKAFSVARKILERVKHEVPIFKLEKRDDGNYWVIGDGKRLESMKSKRKK